MLTWGWSPCPLTQEDRWRGAGLGLMEGSRILGKSCRGVVPGALRGAGTCFPAAEV